MKIFIAVLIVTLLSISSVSYADNAAHTYQFSDENGSRVVRIDTPRDGSIEPTLRPKRPIRNPSIL